MSPHRIVLAYATCNAVSFVLGVSGAFRLPSPPYVILDVVLEAGLVVGLWLLWRPVWIAAIALTLLGGLIVALHPVGKAVVLVIGVIQLALLLLPPLRQSLRTRPLTSHH